MNYCNVATVEGSVITFQCDPGFSTIAEMTATCNSSGQWSTDPSQLVCTWSDGEELVVQTELMHSVTFQCFYFYTPHCHKYKTALTTHMDAIQTCTYIGVGSIDSLSTGLVVGISVGTTFILSILIGLAVGVGVAYLFMRHQTQKSVDITTEGPPQQQPTPGLLYEEIAPAKEEIELKTNEAYGPIRQ